jgi:hypothetical protein
MFPSGRGCRPTRAGQGENNGFFGLALMWRAQSKHKYSLPVSIPSQAHQSFPLFSSIVPFFGQYSSLFYLYI